MSISVGNARNVAVRGAWLGQTPESFQRAVLSRCVIDIAQTGQVLYSVGDPPGAMYCVVSGSLQVSIAPRMEGPYFTHLLQPGDWGGEAAAITGRHRLVGLSVPRRSTLLRLPLLAIHQITNEDPGAWRYFGCLAVLNFATALGVIDDLMIRDDFKRLVSVILRLAGAIGPRPIGEKSNDVPVNQQDIATMANLSRSTTGAFLRRLELEGHVQLVYRRVIVRDPVRLRAYLAS